MIKMANKRKAFLTLSKINYYFDNKSNLLVFLLLLLGVLIPALSGSSTTNFWSRLYSILNSPIFNFMYFVAVGLNVIHISSELSKSYNVVNRYSNYKTLVKNFVRDIVITTIILSIVATILSISGAILFSFGNVSVIKHPNYDIPIVVYIVFFIIRGCIFACIVNSIIYLLSLLLDKIGVIIIILFSSCLFMITPIFYNDIQHFYNMPLLYHHYFLSIQYTTMFLEIICSVLQFFLLMIVYNLIYKFVATKKRDLS